MVPTEWRHHGGKTIRARPVKINVSLPRHLIYRNTNNDCLTKSLFVWKIQSKLTKNSIQIRFAFRANLLRLACLDFFFLNSHKIKLFLIFAKNLFKFLDSILLFFLQALKMIKTKRLNQIKIFKCFFILYKNKYKVIKLVNLQY